MWPHTAVVSPQARSPREEWQTGFASDATCAPAGGTAAVAVLPLVLPLLPTPPLALALQMAMPTLLVLVPTPLVQLAMVLLTLLAQPQALLHALVQDVFKGDT